MIFRWLPAGFLTRDEIVLVVAVLLAVFAGFGVKSWRLHRRAEALHMATPPAAATPRPARR